MNLKTLYIVVLAFSVSSAYAQDEQSGKNLVLFDPLFWKDQLKLDDDQCQRIRLINSQYYEKLDVVARESNHQAVKARAAQTLLERSEEIWETFHPRQRKRWKKIWDSRSQYTSQTTLSSGSES
ncbi:MAG TPA: hypothetical protein VK666_10320 [Chryseolinea sp.]|nr:hypothetical protein [Chryseolinea sp.]